MTRQKVKATAEPETRRSQNCTCAGDFIINGAPAIQ